MHVGDDRLVRARLGQEGGAGRQVTTGRPLTTRHDEDLGLRPALVNLVGKFEAVASDRHVDIRQEDVDRQSRFQNDESLDRIGGLDHSKTGILEKLCDEESDQGLVFDQKNCGLVLGHCFLNSLYIAL